MTPSKLAQARTANAVLEPMPWYRSSVLWGALLAVIGPILQSLGLIANWDDAAANELAGHISNGLTGLGGALTVIGRLRQKAAPGIKAL